MQGHGAGEKSWKTLMGMSLRAVFLQGLWNDSTLQGPGFAWALGALNPRKAHEIMARHMASFNTTPALAPWLVGAVARLERDEAPPSEVTAVRDSGGAAVAAVGDRLFLGSIGPSAALAALAALQLGPLAAASFLVGMQIVPQAVFRLLGIRKGFDKGKGAISECIAAARRALAIWSFVGPVLLGAFAGAVLVGLHRGYGTGGALVALGAVPAMAWLISSTRARPAAVCVVLLVSSGILSLILGS